MEQRQQEEKGRLFGAIIKGVLVGVAIYLIIGMPMNFSEFGDFFTDKEAERTSREETIVEEVEEASESLEIEEYEEEYGEVEESIEIEEVEESEEVFTVVEDMPVFKGCEDLYGDEATQCTMQKIQAYTANVDYPQIAIDNDIEGKVYIRFVVDQQGYVSEVKLLRGVDDLLDNAALNHIKKMPKFAVPGKQRGKNVKVQYNIPIVFRLG